MPKSGNFSPAFLGSLTPAATEDVKIVKAIEDLYQKIVEAQEKAFGPIVKQALKKD